MSHTLRLDFGNLPLVEVTVRATIQPSTVLTLPLIIKLHEAFREELPDIKTPNRYEATPGLPGETVFGLGDLAGVTLSDHRRGLAMVLQSQLVAARWTREGWPDGPEYPRFEQLRDLLWNGVASFSEAVGQRLSPSVVNMSYVNFLNDPDPASVLMDYFSPLVRVQALADASRINKVELSWADHESVDLRFRLEPVEAQVKEQSLSGYRLTTIAGTNLAEAADAANALEKIHDCLQRFFQDLISDRAKAEWQLEVHPDG